MHSASISEHKSEKLSPFETIYQAAKTKNSEVITAILSHACVDVLHPVEGTPISKLAAEGDIEAVNFLRTKFNASLQWMAYGYALGGHVAHAQKVLALASNPVERLTLLQQMAYGYALGGHVDQAKKLLLSASNQTEQFFLLRYMASGYAHGGHFDQAEKLLTSNPAARFTLLMYMVSGYALGGYSDQAEKLLALASNPAERLALLQQMAYGYAQGGHVDQAEKLLTSDPAARPALLQFMARSYARGGHVDQAEKLLALALDPAERLALLTEMACGYAQGGHVDQAEKLLTSNPAARLVLLQNMGNSYALGGHVDQAKKLLASNPAVRSILPWIVLSYTQVGHVDQAEKLLALDLDPAERLACVKIIVSQLQSKGIFSNRDSTLLMLALFNPDAQKQIANELKESKSEMKYDIMALVPKATQLHPLITAPSILTRPINFRYRVGIAWPGIQEWLLMTGVDLVKKGKLNDNILLTIATFLAPISYSESMDFSNRMFTTYRPAHNRLLRSNISNISDVPVKDSKPKSI